MKGLFFQISSRPFDHSQFVEEFRFSLDHPKGNPKEAAHFIYSRDSSGPGFITSTLDLYRYANFPIGIVALSSEKNPERETRKIYVIGRHRYGAMISLNDHSNMNCCRRDAIYAFDAFNVSQLGERNYLNLHIERKFRNRKSASRYPYYGWLIGWLTD